MLAQPVAKAYLISRNDDPSASPFPELSSSSSSSSSSIPSLALDMNSSYVRQAVFASLRVALGLLAEAQQQHGDRLKQLLQLISLLSLLRRASVHPDGDLLPQNLVESFVTSFLQRKTIAIDIQSQHPAFSSQSSSSSLPISASSAPASMFRIPLWWESPIWRPYEDMMEYSSIEELRSDLRRLVGLSLLQNHSKLASADQNIQIEFVLPNALREMLLEEWMQSGLLYSFVFLPQQPQRLPEGTPERKLMEEKLKSLNVLLTQGGCVMVI